MFMPIIVPRQFLHGNINLWWVLSGMVNRNALIVIVYRSARKVDPHIAFWNSLQQGKSPSNAPGTSSTHTTPRQDKNSKGMTQEVERSSDKTVLRLIRLTCPVCSVSSLLIRYIKKNLQRNRMLIFSHLYTHTHMQWTNEEVHSHIISQVVFIQSVGLKPMWRCIKVVTSNATYEAFCLHKTTKNSDED